MTVGEDPPEANTEANGGKRLGQIGGKGAEEARSSQLLEKYKEVLEKDKRQAEELRRFRAEAEEVLELKKK